ncbi:NAD(P)H-hydrate dehydratase [Desulfobaculum bizertense]|uniref:Bifunctional NAD(P)H-hydrate repair enzyme n=1 Tax=Desulfobaculum bizertense DSM 18034 TaxID=1121442 RepID=A0A1T4W3H2_9BACT|nr:NAD(P)H-hydrate dehydratase [Desulfobaculum bizertense]UIJ38790.1 NAD(P)H-hydrate dehydratase [Desulfobaculum bizertense]SKA71699.1 NAD(P)H-hydrate epimerase [Desulfobaculum bizertense DSM 18034]
MEMYHAVPLPTPEEMTAWDQATIEDFGLRQEVLMENAGLGAHGVLEDSVGSVEGLSILVIAGSGNNGGDAFCVARHLANSGAQVLVLHTGKKKDYRGAAAANMRLAQKMGIQLGHLAKGRSLLEFVHDFGEPDVIVDGLLGTGFKGELREETQEWIEDINIFKSSAFILSLDIPSGLSGLTGEPAPVAVMADTTVTFEAAKIGLAMPSSAEFTGDIHVCGIGIPEFIKHSTPATCSMLTDGVLDLLPAPHPEMHKGDAGHVLILGGSIGLTGAPHLAALGAIRSGAGLVTIGCPAGLAQEVKGGNPDIMTLPLGKGTYWNEGMAQDLIPHLSRFSAILLGPGMGRDERTLGFLRALAELDLPKLVVDADALYWIAQAPELLEHLSTPMVLTPHPGEAARILGISAEDVQADRLHAAQDFAAQTGAVSILKGAGTIIALPDGRAYVSPFAISNLAVAGSGDVLGGLSTSLLARDMELEDAACLAVYWHGLAGGQLSEDFPVRGNTASDIANALPKALKETVDA